MPTYRQIDSEQITVATTAIGLTASKLTANLVYAICRVSTAEIRITCKGTPTASAGGVIKGTDEEFEVWGEPDLKGFLAIRTGSVSGKVDVIFMGTPAEG